MLFTEEQVLILCPTTTMLGICSSSKTHRSSKMKGWVQALSKMLNSPEESISRITTSNAILIIITTNPTITISTSSIIISSSKALEINNSSNIQANKDKWTTIRIIILIPINQTISSIIKGRSNSSSSMAISITIIIIISRTTITTTISSVTIAIMLIKVWEVSTVNHNKVPSMVNLIIALLWMLLSNWR